MSTLAPNPVVGQIRSTEFRRLTTARNFELAWRRLMTSSDAANKWFWRPSATVANPIKKSLLKRLRSELNSDLFHADHVSVISQPKPSGLLRHKSILSFGDLLVYQGIANVISPKLRSCVAHRYGRTVFGNILTPAYSPFFFERWQVGYSAYNEAQRTAFDEVGPWVAHYDFASYYDSIDHKVLSNLLVNEVRVGSDVVDHLIRLLEKWTSAGTGISKKVGRLYMNHGVPQGPQPSAMLAEVPFLVIDAEMEMLQRVRYLRYADDVKIFGENEADVRYAAAVMDRLARRVGVFPSAGKCAIQKVEDIEEILKKVSLPNEADEPEDEDFEELNVELRGEKPSRVLWSQLHDLIRDGDTERLTLFKRLVSTTNANEMVARRLLEVMPIRPDLCDVVCGYLDRLPSFGPEIQGKCFGLLDLYPGYAYFTGRVLRVFESRIISGIELAQPVRRQLRVWLSKATAFKGMRSDCQLEGVTRVLVACLGPKCPKRLSKWLRSPSSTPWALVHFILNFPDALITDAWIQPELQMLLDHPIKEVSRAAALRLIRMGVLRPNLPTMDPEAAAMFKAFRMDRTLRPKHSRIGVLLRDLLVRDGLASGDPQRIDWRTLLGDRHDDVEKYCIRFLSDLGTSKNGFILDLDACLEILVHRLVALGRYLFRDRTRALVPVSSRMHAIRMSVDFQTALPHTHALCVGANNIRNRCDRAHSRYTASGAPTTNRSVYQDDVTRVLRLAAPAFRELAAGYPM